MIDAQLVTRMAEVEASYDQTLVDMADPDIAGDQLRYTEVAKHHSELKPLVETYHAYQAASTEADEARELANAESDEEMLAFFREQVETKEAEAEALLAKLHLLLVPKDPNDDKDVI
ncbi:MAG: PCRF domain-containing protein, partial [Acidimicrobiia bacterium]|nr:PCRF domain-containing protein [Acidimicrobiia bacterium]